MFKELHPLIQNRSLTITVATLGGGRIRVNVVPQALESDGKVNDKIGYSNKDKVAKVPDSAIAALTTPLSVTGTPEEMDAELPIALAQFVESHGQLQKTVEEAKEEIAAAVKEVQEREKNKSKSPASATKPDEKKEKPAAGGELLPLWCTPPNDAPAGATSGANPGTSGTEAAAPVQQTLNSNHVEVTP